MGIQSTRPISRDEAISRITEIYELIQNEDYKSLESMSHGEDKDLNAFVQENRNSINIGNIENFTDTMLEDIMDKPYFRTSIFDNYIIEEEEGNEL